MRREVEGNRDVGNRRPPMRQGRGGRGRGLPERPGSQDEGPINRSHINLDRDLWDPIGDAELIEPEVDEFELSRQPSADEDVDESRDRR